jgi:uncharacterized membrane protein YcaP (DUF421 family)
MGSRPSPLGLFWKTLFFYFLLVLVLMGKRELARLSPLDLVVTIMIADAAIIAIEEDRYPVWTGIIPVATIALAEIGLSWGMLKSERIRRWVEGTPALVISRGEIDEEKLRSLRYNLDELLSQLREKQIPDPREVEFAVLETGGKLSVFPKAEKRPATPQDLGMAPPPTDLAIPLVRDGTVDEKALKEAGKSREWLEAQIQAHGLKGPGDVFLLTVDGKGTVFLQPKAKAGKPGPSPPGGGS